MSTLISLISSEKRACRCLPRFAPAGIRRLKMTIAAAFLGPAVLIAFSLMPVWAAESIEELRDRGMELENRIFVLEEQVAGLWAFLQVQIDGGDTSRQALIGTVEDFSAAETQLWEDRKNLLKLGRRLAAELRNEGERVLRTASEAVERGELGEADGLYLEAEKKFREAVWIEEKEELFPVPDEKTLTALTSLAADSTRGDTKIPILIRDWIDFFREFKAGAQGRRRVLTERRRILRTVASGGGMAAEIWSREKESLNLEIEILNLRINEYDKAINALSSL